MASSDNATTCSASSCTTSTNPATATSPSSSSQRRVCSCADRVVFAGVSYTRSLSDQWLYKWMGAGLLQELTLYITSGTNEEVKRRFCYGQVTTSKDGTVILHEVIEMQVHCNVLCALDMYVAN